MKIIWWLPAALAMLVSCSNDVRKAETLVSPFIDLEKLMVYQSQYLKNRNPLVTKIVVSNGKREHKSFRIEDWSKELEIVKKANLDKSAFIGNYNVDSLPLNQYIQKTFTPIKGELSIKFQRILLDSIGNLIRLESVSEDKNILYYTKKELLADFESLNGKSVLKSYATNAIQKIVGLDTFKIQVEVKIR